MVRFNLCLSLDLVDLTEYHCHIVTVTVTTVTAVKETENKTNEIKLTKTTAAKDTLLSKIK